MRPISHLLATLALVCAPALAGCETFVDIDPGGYSPVLIVESRFEAGVPWTVLVRRTVALGDTAGSSSGVPPVEGAAVTITDDLGRTLALPRALPGDDPVAVILNRGAYGAGVDVDDNQPIGRPGPAPEPGRTYTVRVEAPGFPVATATSQAPAAQAGLTAEVSGGWMPPDPLPPPGVLQPYSPVDLAVRFVPTGSPVEVAFVSGFPDAATGLCPASGTAGSSFFTDAPTLTESTFLDDIQSGSGRPRFTSAVLDVDALGRVADGFGSFGMTGESPGPCLVGVEAGSLSAEMFAVRRAEARRRSAEGNPFAEPVPPYSNVDGGAGVFAGATRVRAVIRRSARV